ncbi:MAG: hypothetical protein ACKO01_11580 [Erythrobacter sp.]
MKRGRRTASQVEGSAPDKPRAKLPLPSQEPSTNILIADIVLRAAGGLLRDRLEKGLVTRNHDDDPKAKRMIEKRGITTSAMMWGASRLARRSPIGLAVVAGGLAAKVFYDRGKQLEKQRGPKVPPKDES